MRTSRTIAGAVVLAMLASHAGAERAGAQAPPTGLLVLLLPASPRITALGNAGVAVRDPYSIFYNPAQVAPTPGIGASFARSAPGSAQGAVAGAVTVGSLTYGWGVQLAELEARTGARYPFQPAEVVMDGDRGMLTFVATASANRVFKGFRTGVAVKYAEDRVDPVSFGNPVQTRRVLADVGVSHNLFSGTAALAVQHIDDGSRPRGPLQTSLGWARQLQAKQFDLGVATQLLVRQDWVSPAGGVEVGYGWIEGWGVTARAGARRTETKDQRPFTLGGSLDADRLALDYAVEFYTGNRYTQHVGLRWR